MDIELVRYRTDEGTRPALVAKGHKWIHVLEMGAPVAVRKVPRTEERFMHADLMYKGKPYPMARAIRHFRTAARRNGSTQRADEMLKSAAEQPIT